MDSGKFMKTVKSRIESELELLERKNAIYSDGKDRLYQFKKIARNTGISAIDVCKVLMSKHLQVITDYNPEYHNEKIYDSIRDARNY